MPSSARLSGFPSARSWLVWFSFFFHFFPLFSYSHCQKRECTPFGVHPFWLLFISRVVAWEEVEGIDGCAVDSDFVVAVRAGAVSGAAHDGDDAALVDVLAYGDENGGVYGHIL